MNNRNLCHARYRILSFAPAVLAGLCMSGCSDGPARSQVTASPEGATIYRIAWFVWPDSSQETSAGPR